MPPNYVAVGTHFLNGSKDGEQIKVVNAQNHTDFNIDEITYNFAVLTLERASKYLPVKLAKADNSDMVVGMWSKVMGWGETTDPNGVRSNELHSVGLDVWSDEDCTAIAEVDNSSFCAGGATKKSPCNGDMGDPLIKELGRGDADDILIGLVSYGFGCGLEGVPGIFSHMSAAIEWINRVTKPQ